MSKLRCHISISVDGFVAGPNQSEENPLGEGGERLHDWVVPLAAWRQPHGKQSGEVDESTSSPTESSPRSNRHRRPRAARTSCFGAAARSCSSTWQRDCWTSSSSTSFRWCSRHPPQVQEREMKRVADRQ